MGRGEDYAPQLPFKLNYEHGTHHTHNTMRRRCDCIEHRKHKSQSQRSLSDFCGLSQLDGLDSDPP